MWAITKQFRDRVRLHAPIVLASPSPIAYLAPNKHTSELVQPADVADWRKRLIKKRNHSQTVRAGYNAMARKYLATRNGNSEDVRLLDELVKRLPRGARVLDAGCGAGVPVTEYLSRHFEVTGVDFAEAQIELARELVPDGQFECCDIFEANYPHATFDAICSYYAIIHIPREKHRGLVKRFHRWLKPSGLALLCLGSDDLDDDIVEDYLGVRMYWSHFDKTTYLDMLDSCGFETIWSRLVPDSTSPGSEHLFVLVQKQSD
jgi:SAM-dependent methyltransferase